MTRVGELSKCPHRRAEAVEFDRRESIRLVGAAEIDELAVKLVDDVLGHRRVDPRLHLDVAAVEALLPDVRR